MTCNLACQGLVLLRWVTAATGARCFWRAESFSSAVSRNCACAVAVVFL